MDVKEPILLDLEEAQKDIEAWQKRGSMRIQKQGPAPPIHRIASADVAYSVDGRQAFAGVILMEWPSQRLLERVGWIGEVPADYQSGAFSLREAPCLIEAFRKLQGQPDLLLLDGHGWMHPRRFGLACHLGLLFDLPTLGVGKTPLVGHHGDLPQTRGASAWIVEDDEPLPFDPEDSEDPRILGAALRTQDGVKPVYVSVGHKLSLEACIALVLATAPSFRLPEPLRAAHLLSIDLRAGKRP